MRIVWGFLSAAALTVAAAGPASALGYVEFNPRYNGFHVAGCPTAQFCGNAILQSASDYCRTRGLDRATNYKTDAVRARPGAWHIATRTACQHPNCIMFTEITCAARAAPANQPVRINRPMMHGAIVDWCATWTANCGGTSPNLVCRQMGYSRATSYAAYYPGRTFVMGSNRFCEGPRCRGLAYVMCVR